MYFSGNYELRQLEKIMSSIPNFKPRGHGVVILRKYEYTDKDCDCDLCPFYLSKQNGCSATKCQCINERIIAGAATLKEAAAETMAAINYPPFAKRLNQYLKESEENPMYFKNNKHRTVFTEAVAKLDKKDYALMAAIYLSPQEQMKFKAVLSAEHPIDLDDIGDVIANLNKYELSAYVDSDSDFFKSYLKYHLGTGFDHKWLGGLFAKDEGTRLLERRGAANTEYGVISAREGTLYDLVPYDKQPTKKLTNQALTDEKLEVVEVLGQTALFTNGRVTEQELPEGLYKYDLREGETLSFSSIAPYVLVNHGGTVLLKAPIDFGDEKYIVFDDDTTPNFLGCELTPKEFMDTDFTQAESEERQEMQIGGALQ